MWRSRRAHTQTTAPSPDPNVYNRTHSRPHNPVDPDGEQEYSTRGWFQTRFAPAFEFLRIENFDWNMCFIVSSIIILVAIFTITIVGWAMVASNQSDTDTINDFSKRLVRDYLSNQCVQCNATGGQLIYLKDGSAPLQIVLYGESLSKTQFPLGFTTLCETCEVTVPSTTFTVAGNATRFRGNMLIKEGFLSADRFHMNENGITYDTLGLWLDQNNVTNATNGGISPLKPSERCHHRTLGSIYTVVSSASTSMELCCDYYLCMCILNAYGMPNEYCTHALINTNSASTESRLNCIVGNTTLGCDCSDPIC